MAIGSKAAKYDIIIEQGEDYRLDISLDKNSADLNITDIDFEAAHKPNYGATTSTPFSVVKLNNATGQISLQMAHAETTKLASGVGVYDLWMYNDSQWVRLLQGTCTVRPAVYK